MADLTPTQQLILDTMAEQGGVLGDTEVNQASLRSLVGRELVTKIGAEASLTSTGWEAANFPHHDDEEETEVDVQVEVEQQHDEPAAQVEPTVQLYVELGAAMTVQVDPHKHLTVTVPAGTAVPVVGFKEETGRRAHIIWYTCLEPNSGVPFLVAINNTNKRSPSAHRLLRVESTPDEE